MADFGPKRPDGGPNESFLVILSLLVSHATYRCGPCFILIVGDYQNKKWVQTSLFQNVNYFASFHQGCCATWFSNMFQTHSRLNLHKVIFWRICFFNGKRGKSGLPAHPPWPRFNKSSKDCTWSAVPDALLGLISWRNGVRAEQRPQKNESKKSNCTLLILTLAILIR